MCLLHMQVLASEVNIGYEEIVNTQVHQVNGKPVKNLSDLTKQIEGCTDQYLRFDLEYNQVRDVLLQLLSCMLLCRQGFCQFTHDLCKQSTCFWCRYSCQCDPYCHPCHMCTRMASECLLVPAAFDSGEGGRTCGNQRHHDSALHTQRPLSRPVT